LPGRSELFAAALLAAWSAGCSFPEHQFIEDREFFASGGGSGAGGGNGGTSGSSGSSGVGGQMGDCPGETHTCVPPVPTGWQGPVAVYQGSGATPDCGQAGGYPTPVASAKSGLEPGTVTCPTCSCGSISGTKCEADLVFVSEAGCLGGTCWGSGAGCPGGPDQVIPISSTCTSYALTSVTGLSARAAIFTNLRLSGSCDASSSGQKSVPTPVWSQEVRACGDPANTGGCPSGALCVPRPQAPFGATPCILKQNEDSACPSPFSNKISVYTGFQDDRDCSPCACQTSGGSCDSVAVQLYTDAGCSAGLDTLTVSDTCTAIKADPDPEPNPPAPAVGPADTRSWKLTATPNTAGATCAPSGGGQVGFVTGTGLSTLCCL
jgi:hypothetical protein